MTTIEKRKIRSRDEIVRYLLNVAQKSNIDLSIANEVETRRILKEVPSLSKEMIKNRHS